MNTLFERFLVEDATVVSLGGAVPRMRDLNSSLWDVSIVTNAVKLKSLPGYERAGTEGSREDANLFVQGVNTSF